MTCQGHPVAIILPLDTWRAGKERVRAGRKATLGNWEHYERPADHILDAWPAGMKTQDLIDAIRDQGVACTHSTPVSMSPL